MNKLKYLFLLFFLFPLSLVAQQNQIIRGKVTDAADKTPIPGVAVTALNNGNKVTASTDQEGNYQIAVPAGTAELTFSFVGMTTLVEKINDRTTINIGLSASLSELSEVIVVGYGSQKKETLTGSVGNITARDIQTTTAVSLAQKIQGKVAGLQIRQNGGEPGTFDNSINIRGYGGSPLYVIDGIAREGGGEFQRINPDDIESISFLKDGSAAIYGLRASNGVVLVTTKKGAKGDAAFNYNGFVGLSSPTDVPRMANASEWMQMRNDAAFLGTGAPFVTREELNKYIAGGPGYESTDWYDEVMKKNALQQQHNLSASGGSEKTQYFVSLGYQREEGLLKTNDMGFYKYNMRSNLTTELTKNLKAEVFVAGRYDNRYVPGENFFNIFKGTRVTLPTEQPYVNGNMNYPSIVTPSNQNPVVLSDKNITGYNESVNRNFQSTVALNYTIPAVEGLKLRASASYDMNSYSNKDLSKPYNLYTFANANYVKQPQRVGTGNISNVMDNNNNLTLQGQIIYSRLFAGKHNVGGTLVIEQQQGWSRNTFAKRFYDFFTTDQLRYAGLRTPDVDGIEGQSAYLGYVGRFNYDYASKYLIDVIFRQDGNYAYKNKWGFFPGASAAWRISEEGFIKNNLPAISNLKLKASYGTAGAANAVAPFQYVPGFGTSGGGNYEFLNDFLTTGVAAPSIVNENLSWTKSEFLDFGVELGLWKNKLTAEFDVYQRDTKGIPATRNVSLPNTFGASIPPENLNSDRVRGIEFSLTHNNAIGDFKYGISGNFNFSRQMNLYIEGSNFTNSYDRWRNQAAYRNKDISWGYTYAGQFQSREEILQYALQNGDQANIRELPGDYKFQDINNDGVIDDRDMLPLFDGSTPKLFYGLTLNGSYKGFDFNVLLQGSGRYTVRFTEVYGEILAFRGNTPAYFFDRWRLSDPYDANSAWIPGKYPASRFNNDVGRVYTESSVWRRDASYVRLKSVELGYSFQPSFFAKAGIKKLRVYASAFNLFTITDPFVKPFDPERAEGLFNAGLNYPLSKTYNFGVNLNF
ncbi:MAG TPA: TonB-dependent receptor [Pedobacter sp.]|nr:TonB-dependent receptor [Pedobacter sp.]